MSLDLNYIVGPINLSYYLHTQNSLVSKDVINKVRLVVLAYFIRHGGLASLLVYYMQTYFPIEPFYRLQ